MFSIQRKLTKALTAVIFVCLVLSVLNAVAISATVTVQVQTDRTQYAVGDTVNWTLYVWASAGDNRGVSLLSVNLDDDTADKLEPALIHGIDFQDTAYGTGAGFMKFADGTVSVNAPDLVDMTVMQLPITPVYDIGNDGSTDHIFAKGSYTVNVVGDHLLTGSFNAANYWPGTTPTAMDFEIKNTIPAAFSVTSVTPNADINGDLIVDYLDFAIISANWGGINCDQSENCDGADVNLDGDVDMSDMLILIDQWLTSTAVSYNADINKDGFVDYLDFATVSAYWNESNCVQYADCDGADINHDDIVNVSDLMILVEQWLTNPLISYNADINKDNFVDYLDFATVSAYWNESNCVQYADCGGADINHDGRVNVSDLMIFADQWL